ncbi:ABC transporter permease [Hydrogenophaga sp. UC242_50]|uniref:ABC transporter permease n=1 Tax=Hydrogenophaga sp. UC242_50 TaxID=3350169 RepID=UPI0036D403FB
MLVIFGGNYYNYDYLGQVITLLGSPLKANRLLALGFAVVIGVGLYLVLHHTRRGTALRAVAVSPTSAQLVAIDVRKAAAFAFALGGGLVAASGTLVSMFFTINASMGVVFTMKALIVVIMGGVGNLMGCLVAGLLLGLTESLVAHLRGARPHARGHLRPVPAGPHHPPHGHVRKGRGMKRGDIVFVTLGVAGLAACALLPFFGSGYAMSMAINLLIFTVLATAWALFSGPTGYVSLATVAFFGLGVYVAAVFGEAWPWPAVLATAALAALAVALLVGLRTLRLRGVYFVIFTFGLAELIRQVVTWYEANHSGSVGRYLFLDIEQKHIVWQLTALAALVYLAGWLVKRSRVGLALRMIGDDEMVARHCGVHTTFAKLLVFGISAMFMVLAGAIVAPRWTYIDPTIAFNPVVSFQVLIMALLGGAARLHGPVLGVIPLVLLFEFLSANFPNYFSILLGCTFLVIVYLAPRGIVGLMDRLQGGKA